MYVLYDILFMIYLFFLGKTVHHNDAKIPKREYKTKLADLQENLSKSLIKDKITQTLS